MGVRPALLLLGPTGSGKTPLGTRIERDGLWGRRWAHFDFGQQMRAIVARGGGPGIFPSDVGFLRRVLESGVLLEEGQFELAERIFHAFVAERGLAESDGVVLNGLPRHVGQAAAMERLADVRWVVELACTAEVVGARIASNVGGDRTHRPDDDPAAVRRKLETYQARTAPLVDHYRGRAAAIVRVDVMAGMTEAEMYRAVGEPHGQAERSKASQVLGNQGDPSLRSG